MSVTKPDPAYLWGYHEGADVLVPLYDNASSTLSDTLVGALLDDLVIGVDADQVPLNQHLGTMAYQSEEAINVGVVEADELRLDKTISGTTGAQTIDKPAGTVDFAAAATSLVVTNSLVTSSSVILATVATNDATMTSVQAVAASGSFTLHANAGATGTTRVNWMVVN